MNVEWERFEGVINGNPVSRAQIVAEARTWIGVPFRHQGDTRLGVDCGGLIKAVLMEVGLLARDYLAHLPQEARGYPGSPDGVTLQKACGVVMTPIPIDQIQPADVLLIAWRGGFPQHTAIVVPYRAAAGHLAVVHALGPGRHSKVVEHRIDEAFRKQVVAAYSIPGVVE